MARDYEEYKRAAILCPDELSTDAASPGWRLTREFGFYDNWPILFLADYDTFLSRMPQLGFSCGPVKQREYGLHCLAIYAPGTIEAQVRRHAPPTTLSRYLNGNPMPGELQYPMSVMLHPYQENRKMETTHWLRPILHTTFLLTEYARSQGWPFALPGSCGTDHLFNISRTVVHPAE